MLTLNACSSTNVSGEWDCPRQMGHGCITIDEADQIAVEKLNSKYKEPLDLKDVENDKIIENKERKVWLAPRSDGNGNRHEASTIYYYEEIKGDQDSSGNSVPALSDNDESIQ